MENWDINWDNTHILCIHYTFLAGTVICPITHTIILTGRNYHLPHYAYIQLYIYTYWQELSSAPLRIHTVIHLYLLAENCHLSHYAYIQLYIYTYRQELSSAPLRIHTVIQLYLLAGTVICPITQTYSYTFYLLAETVIRPLHAPIVIPVVICPITHTYSYTI